MTIRVTILYSDTNVRFQQVIIRAFGCELIGELVN